ncbi:hypothetical protein BXY58_2153 [Epilithonimonas arachidiradicis]|uniref:Uncharacterized protein n=1 Tax=Epilithonimonas arachidiradicis TaxID=1617282 RepID=A0A420D931_9FLAO|nr:hypothetical protein BXY58_2153 [Epilithonimonas arachidiradicis]
MDCNAFLPAYSKLLMMGSSKIKNGQIKAQYQQNPFLGMNKKLLNRLSYYSG